MKNFILSPCGTSLLTNGKDNKNKGIVFEHSNAKNKEDISEEAQKTLGAWLETRKQELMEASVNKAAELSAELNALIHFYEGDLSGHAEDMHYLLSTDTWLGGSTAGILQEWLQEKGMQVHVHRQTDLHTKELLPFQLALSNLAKELSEIVPQYKARGYRIIFNLTGGFKGVQGFLQSIANFYADETIYIFEKSENLLRIPSLPIKLSIEESLANSLTTFRRLSLGLPLQDSDSLEGIPDTLLLRIDGEYRLSPWGEILWKEAQKELYKARLYESPSPKIRYGKGFADSTKKIEADRLFLVNQRIDDLARYLEDPEHPKLKRERLDLKKLQGDPRPPSTHELDAWSDKDARRIFGHYDGDVFVLDALDKGLH